MLFLVLSPAVADHQAGYPIFTLGFLVEARARVYDRPPRFQAVGPDLNKRSKALFNKYPDPVRPYTEADILWSGTE